MRPTDALVSEVPSASNSAASQNVIFSCVIDSPPELQFAAWIWATTLINYGHQPPEALAAHFVDGTASALRREFDELGIRTGAVDRVDAEHPPSNKLAQLNSHLLADADYVVLCDCDLAFCADIGSWASGQRIRAKLVDCAVFSLDDWKRILRNAELSYDCIPPRRRLPKTLDGKRTIPSYCNGGLLIIPSQALLGLRDAWPRWNQWLRANPELLGSKHYHTDQVSFALACIESGLEIDLLPDKFNVPTHLHNHRKRLKRIDPAVLHFHRHLDPHGRLQDTGVRSIDRRISQVNDLLDEQLHNGFNNGRFWDYRYSTCPTLGSGIASRGELVEYKRDILAGVLAERAPQSVLDIGCGDLEPWHGLQPTGYTGVDVSQAAIDVARRKRPDLDFQVGSLDTLTLQPHDLVLAFDVLIHQPSMAAYEGLLSSLIALTARTLLVSGYTEAPTLTSPITFFFESLHSSLIRLCPGGVVRTVGRYRDIEVRRSTVTSLGRDCCVALTSHAHHYMCSAASASLTPISTLPQLANRHCKRQDLVP
jgi:SAM-dependent methyltransferase